MGEEDCSIFISEELTKEVYALFKSSKGLRNQGFKYIWHKGGKVFARKEEGEKAVFIKNDKILNDLLA